MLLYFLTEIGYWFFHLTFLNSVLKHNRQSRIYNFINTFATTSHMCNTAVRFESLASRMCEIVDYLYVYKLIINYLFINCCWLSICFIYVQV